jgi:hypothetical protein
VALTELKNESMEISGQSHDLEDTYEDLSLPAESPDDDSFSDGCRAVNHGLLANVSLSSNNRTHSICVINKSYAEIYNEAIVQLQKVEDENAVSFLVRKLKKGSQSELYLCRIEYIVLQEFCMLLVKMQYYLHQT